MNFVDVESSGFRMVSARRHKTTFVYSQHSLYMNVALRVVLNYEVHPESRSLYIYLENGLCLSFSFYLIKASKLTDYFIS